MKAHHKRKIAKIEERLNLKQDYRRLAKIICDKGQENFDTSTIDADIILIHPYNGRCRLPEGYSYPESFKNGPVIIWSSLKL